MAEKYEFGRRFYLLWKKRPNISSSAIFIISLLLTLNSRNYVAAEGNVGCHFVKTLCLNGIEYCFDDLVFGICRPLVGIDNNEDYEKKPLTERQSQILGQMLEEMQGVGLGWDHPFVQCKIQGTLFSMRKKVPIPPTLCSNLAPSNSPPVRHFTPSEDTILDEYFYPVPFKKNLNHHSVEYPRRQIVDPTDELSKILYYPNRHFDDDMYYKLSQAAEPPAEYESEMESRMEDIKSRIELGKMLAEYEQARSQNRVNDIPEYEDVGVLPPEYYGFNNFKRSELTLPIDEDKPLPKTYFREYAINEHIPLQPHHLQRSHLTVDMPSEIIRPADINEMEADEEAKIYETNIFPSRKHHKKSENGLFTEGGVLKISDKNEPKGDTQRILAEMLGFTRRERLDVKKPGPVIGPPPAPEEVPKAETKEVLPSNFKESGEIKVVLAPHQSEEDNHAPHIVDTEFAYVKTKNRIDNWKDGNKLVNELAKILHMENAFSHVRIDSHEVSWKVIPAFNATEVAKMISDSRVKQNIVRRLGITIEETGIGDKVKLSIENQPQVDLINSGPDVGHIMFYMFAGAAVAATLVISVTWFLIRRHDKKRDKLGGLKSGSDQACSSDDYQDLCRARMSGKGNTSVEPVQSGRITSLTKENDRPPSSRSSTSSWSEEPVLSNMDISTGHMVLSYMEDHLKNKGRLQREWEALCRYEAEPSARDAAMQTQCAALNRLGAPLPYDHSRVVLNHLANAEGLDYINASTITDHDPRAPAYVAAQGPLSTTLSHFWQMIWEQGAVVIVTLGKMQDNGEISCFRYWPEEGAEVYHIYEVHLVSEHIWCDDYLVRSFYLKNLRTSETRTVTQFHFLSWPQNGVPASAKALLEFRRKVNKSYRGRSCPIVVHGSAGAGRTGAYILLDLVLGRMNKGAREIDIAATLEHLRDQRAGLVANRQQFEFVLMAVAEEVHAILKNLPANQSNEKRELDKETLKEENGGDSNKPTDKTTQEKNTDNDNGKSDKNEK